MMLSIDERIDQLAATQMGLVTRAQLLACGIPPDLIDRRVRANRLWRVHRGVYRVGPLVLSRTRELAAVLACGPHAALSHRSAGALWQLLPAEDEAAPVDVSLSQGNRGRRPKIRVHRVSMTADDVTNLEGIPITSVSRTVLDLTAVLAGRDIESVLARAERLHALDAQTLRGLTTRQAGRPGAPRLRAMLETEAGPAMTRSAAEERFLALIRKAELPSPEANVRMGEYEIDFLWRRERLVVEVDGFAFHSSKHKFETDRLRDARLTAQGLAVIRVTWRQIEREPEALLVRVGQSLARAGPIGISNNAL